MPSPQPSGAHQDPTAPGTAQGDQDVIGLEMNPLGSLLPGLTAGAGPEAGTGTTRPSSPENTQVTVKLPRP